MGTLSKDQIKDFWKERGQQDTIDVDKRDPFWDDFEKEMVLNAFDKLNTPIKKSEIHILDVGCGTGRLLKFLSEKGYKRLTGIDYVKECVEITQERVPQANCHIMDVINLQFPPESFDICISCRTLQSLPTKEEKKKAIQQIITCLKKGGYLVLLEGNADRLTPHPDYNYYLNVEEWKSIFKEEQLIIERIQSVPLSTILMLIDKKQKGRPLIRDHPEFYEALYKMDTIIGAYQPGFVSHELGFIIKKG